MALVETTRIRLGPTSAERAALNVASWISLSVANRMGRRAQRAAELHTTQAIQGAVALRRDDDRAKAYLLGIR